MNRCVLSQNLINMLTPAHTYISLWKIEIYNSNEKYVKLAVSSKWKITVLYLSRGRKQLLGHIYGQCQGFSFVVK